ncbi:hypothetical protein Zm00014a_020151 [Zea mays]|uniref:Uncharacterized protein n=1 Tax=Zea mays TaxID=4577 RepID=A0A3L6G963_MAIZE|nr:hypothetical protein Zm00014a_020151 [Zea mays]
MRIDKLVQIALCCY